MTRDQLFMTVSKGNAAAAQFLHSIVGVLHVWDDLIDLDKPVQPEEINAAFMTALIDLPRNQFYMRNFELLNPLLLSAINNWMVANQLEATADIEDKRIAFISRSSYIDLITQVAFLVGGSEWVQEVGQNIRRFAHSEGWDGYLQNLETEREARARTLGD